MNFIRSDPDLVFFTAVGNSYSEGRIRIRDNPVYKHIADCIQGRRNDYLHGGGGGGYNVRNSGPFIVL